MAMSRHIATSVIIQNGWCRRVKSGCFFISVLSRYFQGIQVQFGLYFAIRFIDEAITLEKPFFLYFASTLVHGGDSRVYEALTSRSFTESPKGTLYGDDVPNDTSMRSREMIWSAAVDMAGDRAFQQKMKFAKYLWVDESFGAVVDYLKSRGIYDDTLIVVQSDHGQEAKGM